MLFIVKWLIRIFLKQRSMIQTAAVSSPITIFGLSVSSIGVLSRIHYGRLLILIYLIYLKYDINKPQTGGRPVKWLRNLFLWNYFRSYFPINFVKKTKLDPQVAYLLGIHPHGLWSTGVWGNLLATNSGALSEINLRVVTISTNFYMPIWRDFLLGMGLADSSQKSIQNMLRQNISVGIVVGGAEEALESRPGVNDLTLHNRLGFIRIALQEHVPVVPIYQFGETDLYNQVSNPPGSFIRTVQTKFKEYFGFSPVFVTNILPKRRNVTMVIGEPLHFPHISNPSVEEILKYHKIYVESLQDLFDEYHEILQPKSRSLRIVDNQKVRSKL